MNKNNYWIKSGLINISQSILSVLFSFLTLYFLVRILTKEDYGVWSLFLGTTSIIEIARNGLTQEALIKFYSSANDQDKAKITTAAFFINFSTTILISIAIVFLAPLLSESWKSPVMTDLYFIFLINFFISGILNVMICIEQASLNFSGIFYTNIVRQLIIFIYPCYCYVTNTPLNLKLLAFLQILSIAISTIIIFIHAKKYLIFSKMLDFKWTKKILSFGVFTFGISVSAILAGSIDQMMLGWFLSTAATGVFSVALRITNLTDIPTSAMVTIIYPQLSRRIVSEGNNSAKYLYERSVGVILSILLPTVLAILIFSEPILHFVAGQKYDESLSLLNITLITCIFAPFGRQSGTVFNSAGMSRLNFVLVIISMTLIIVMNYFMIGHYGIMGAAYATLIANFLGVMIAFYFLRKHFNINPLNCFIYAYKFYPEFYNQYVKKIFNKK